MLSPDTQTDILDALNEQQAKHKRQLDILWRKIAEHPTEDGRRNAARAYISLSAYNSDMWESWATLKMILWPEEKSVDKLIEGLNL